MSKHELLFDVECEDTDGTRVVITVYDQGASFYLSPSKLGWTGQKIHSSVTSREVVFSAINATYGVTVIGVKERVDIARDLNSSKSK